MFIYVYLCLWCSWCSWCSWCLWLTVCIWYCNQRTCLESLELGSPNIPKYNKHCKQNQTKQKKSRSKQQIAKIIQNNPKYTYTWPTERGTSTLLATTRPQKRQTHAGGKLTARTSRSPALRSKWSHNAKVPQNITELSMGFVNWKNSETRMCLLGKHAHGSKGL